MNSLLQAALHYAALGFSVVPVRENKKATLRWKVFQRVPMRPGQIIRHFQQPDVYGVALICGEVSQNLEVIDIDVKYDLTGQLYQHLQHRIDEQLPGIMARVGIGVTGSHGFHLYYRCSDIGGNTELAKRATTPAERAIYPDEPCKVLIETRGRAGYIIAEPTPGYALVQGSYAAIPAITRVERAVLHSIARGFNSYMTPVETPRMPFWMPRSMDNPLDAFDADPDRRNVLVAILEKHHWTIVRTTAIQTFVRRPGKTLHDTSGDYHHQLNLLTLFSPNTPFTAGKGYRPSAVYAILECNADFSLAAKRLVEAGYGKAYRLRHFL